MGNTSTPRSFWQTLLFFNFIVNLTMMRLTYLHQVELKSNLLHSAWTGVIALCLFIALASVWLILQITRGHSATLNWLDQLDRFHVDNLFIRIFTSLIFLIIVFLIPYLKFKFQIGQDVKKPIYDPVLLSLAYYWFCWWLIVLAMT